MFNENELGAGFSGADNRSDSQAQPSDRTPATHQNNASWYDSPSEPRIEKKDNQGQQSDAGYSLNQQNATSDSPLGMDGMEPPKAPQRPSTTKEPHDTAKR
jgi:hypothetical protein